MQYASSHRSTSKKVELTKGLWNCSSRYVVFPTTADHFLSCESIKCFLLSPMFQNSKGDELRSTLPAMLADMVAKSERCRGD